MHSVRGGKLVVSDLSTMVATWNVEGLTEEKIITIQNFMAERRIAVICLQETHKPRSDVFVTEGGFLLILSGSNAERENAGVGFIIAPEVRRSVVAFVQKDSRMASLKLRIPGGKMSAFSAYAPHAGYPFPERQAFFENLASFYNKTSAFGSKVILGDMNARVYRRLAGEDDIIGEFFLKGEGAPVPDNSNRHLLVEMCVATSTALANTTFDKPADQLATCYNIGAAAFDEVSWRTHGQIDYVIVPKSWQHVVQDIVADRTAALASHHFLLTADLTTYIPITTPKDGGKKPLVNSLRTSGMSNSFASLFDLNMEAVTAEPTQNVNLLYARIVDSFQHAAQTALPQSNLQPRRPWISAETLSLIEQRNSARAANAQAEEKQLTKKVRASVEKDRGVWLDSLLENGSWDSIRKLRKGRMVKQGRLRAADGTVIPSSSRAERLAEHLETVQWAVRPSVLVEERAPKTQLPVKLSDIATAEVESAAKRLRYDRAAGLDNVPAEFWRAVLETGSPTSQWIVTFCQACWDQKAVPEVWHDARVAML